MDRLYSSPEPLEEEQGGQPAMLSVGPATPYQPSACSSAKVPLHSPASSSTTPLRIKTELDTPVKNQFDTSPKSESVSISPETEEAPEQNAFRKLVNAMGDVSLGEGKTAEPEGDSATQFSYQPPTLFGPIGGLAGQAASSAQSLFLGLPDAD